MPGLLRRATQAWIDLGPRYMPFADITTPDLTLARLLRLSLFQVSVGMAMVLLVGTLNRVMIVELGVSSSLVGTMIALPLVFAPLRALIGFKSDSHRSEFGWRRVPFIWKGTLWQWAGFAIMPWALLVLSRTGNAADAPVWIGQSTAALAFLLVGAGVHTVQTAGLALATDLTPKSSHPRVVGLMYVMLLLGMITSALLFGALLADYSPGRLVQVIQGAAVVTLILNGVAMWKQEAKRAPRPGSAADDPGFRESWIRFCAGGDTVRRLVVVGIGTMAFGMADILLEPFGGQVLNLSVGATTRLTALFAFGGLLGFAFASWRLANGADAYRLARTGVLLGIPAFLCVMLAAPVGLPPLFLLGNFLIGFGAALFGHGTLTATMHAATRDQVGLAIGAWGAVQATAAGVAVAMSGVIRDLVNVAVAAVAELGALADAATGYVVVYSLEISMLLITVIAVAPLTRGTPRGDAPARQARAAGRVASGGVPASPAPSGSLVAGGVAVGSAAGEPPPGGH